MQLVWLEKKGKLRRTRYKGRNSTVHSIQLTWTGQYKKCVQYDFRFTSIYSTYMELRLWLLDIYFVEKHEFLESKIFFD